MFPRFVSPLCLPVVSPRGVSPGRVSQCNESGWAFCANARALVENESEQFPVASAVPVAPQWGEQRGKTTGTTIGKHNGKKNRKQQRKVKKTCMSFFYLLNCFKIMSVCKSKEKNENHTCLNYFFLKMGTSPKSSVFATVGSRTSTQQRGSATG